jgi:hypothetical protein
MGAQEALDERDRGRAVDIVVAEHGNRLVSPDGRSEALGRLLHVLEARGVGQKRAERGVEIAGGGVGLHAARGKHAAEQFGQTVRLRNGRGSKRAARIEALDPAVEARGTLDAEKRRRARQVCCWVFQGRGHSTPSTR